MRFFLSIFGVILFIVAVIVIIATSGPSKTIKKSISLTSYNYPGSSVTQTTSGELVGDSQRRAIQITVSQSAVSIFILSGYNQTVSNSETFQNNSTSYGVFLGALQNAMFTSSRKTTETNMFGVCPIGNTFQYRLNNSTNTVSNLWSTSCSLNDGTFNGNGPLIRQLFSLQIPNYNSFIQSTDNTINDPVD
jgi:hypothetical protein